MAFNEISPGIGNIHEADLGSNRGTRAVLVSNSVLTDPQELTAEAMGLSDLASNIPAINREVVKAVTLFELPRTHIGDAFCVESSLPFTYEGHEFCWTVAARNKGEREPDFELAIRQEERLHELVANNGTPQSATQMVDFVTEKNRGKTGEIELLRITPNNFHALETGLRKLYGSVFTEYPYDVARVIETTCDRNVFVVAVTERHGTEVLAVTGAERAMVANIPVAEIGDSAATDEFAGLGALTKAYLLQTLYDLEAKGIAEIPAIAFTDSRISGKLAVIRANHRAGLYLPGNFIPLLHWHTIISSSQRDPGNTRTIKTPQGEGTCENMTMTYTTGDILRERYGTQAPFWRIAPPGENLRFAL